MTLRINYAVGEVLPSADVNAANGVINTLGTLLDPATGKLAAAAVPSNTAAAIAKAEADAQAGIAAAGVAQSAATSAGTAATAAGTAAGAAASAASAAKTEADANASAIAAINANANAAGGFAKLLSPSALLPLAVMPYKPGSNITIAADGTISAAGGSGPDANFTPPTPATFPVWVNQGNDLTRSYLNSTATRGLKVGFQNIRGDNGLRGVFHALPAPGTAWQATACIDLSAFTWVAQGIGFSRYDSVSGKLQQINLLSNTTNGVVTQSEIHEFIWSSYAAVSTDTLLYNLVGLSRIWFRVTDNGASDATAQLWEVSRSGDPDDWWAVRGGMRTDYLGSAPTHFGITASCYSGNVLSAPDPTLFLRHYAFTHS